MGFAGMLFGPAVIGFVANLTSLRGGLLLAAALGGRIGVGRSLPAPRPDPRLS
jgi:hypothetical protein